MVVAIPSYLCHKPVLAGLGQNLLAAGGRLDACPKKVKISARVSSHTAVSVWPLPPRVCTRTEHRLSGWGFDRQRCDTQTSSALDPSALSSCWRGL